MLEVFARERGRFLAFVRRRTWELSHLDPEDIVAEVLRRTRLDVGEKFQALFDTYLGFDTARFDPDVLGVPMAPLLRSFGGGG